jgi:hypothetical protein
MRLLNGFEQLKFLGVGLSWIFRNIHNRIKKKTYLKFSEIWDGNKSIKPLDSVGYDMFYAFIGLIGLLAVILLLLFGDRIK